MLEEIEIERKKSKYIEKEIVVPSSHTEIYLNERGKEILRKIDQIPELSRKLSLDLTNGGGYDPSEGTIHIPHISSEPVWKKWKKIHELFNKVEKELEAEKLKEKSSKISDIL